MDQDFCAWFAGFWEGEGSLSIGSSNRNFTQLDVCQSGERGRAIIAYIKNQFQFGRVYVDSHDKKHASWQPRWHWRVCRIPLVIQVLETIQPHLKMRGNEVARKLKLLKEMDLSAVNHSWTEQEIAYLKDNYGKLSAQVISNKLGRHTVGSIWMKAKYLKLARPQTCKKWTTTERELVIDLRKKGLTHREIANRMGRTIYSVKDMSRLIQ